MVDPQSSNAFPIGSYHDSLDGRQRGYTSIGCCRCWEGGESTQVTAVPESYGFSGRYSEDLRFFGQCHPIHVSKSSSIDSVGLKAVAYIRSASQTTIPRVVVSIVMVLFASAANSAIKNPGSPCWRPVDSTATYWIPSNALICCDVNRYSETRLCLPG